MTDAVLPSDLESIVQNQVIANEILDPEKRFNGLNVFRQQQCDLKSIRERECDIFSILEH